MPVRVKRAQKLIFLALGQPVLPSARNSRDLRAAAERAGVPCWVK
jgi:hypothetical protein